MIVPPYLRSCSAPLAIPVALVALLLGCARAGTVAHHNAPPNGTPGALSLIPGTPLPQAHRRWIDSTLSALTPRERVAQMIMVWVLGDYTNAREPGFLKLIDQVKREGIGGVVMSLGSPIEVADKVNSLQRQARIPLLVASDVEPGLGRLEGGVFVTSVYSAGSATVLPSNMAIGAADSEIYAETMGRITGLESRGVGIHMAFAPVVDVNNNPSNPVINTRSFGENPQRVAALSAAFIRGLQGTGVAATAKHFPGHGDTDTDSHLGLPVINVPRQRLDEIELVPFVASIRAGAAGMMTAHIALPVAYGDSTPATLSTRIMRGLLRDTLRFRGLTVTDAMTMEGIAKGFGIEESSIRSVEAGDDVLLMPPDVTRAINAVVGAVESGRIAPARIDESVRRILELKLRTGAIARPLVSLETLRESVGSPEHRHLALQVAERAITLLRDRASLLPVAHTAALHVITFAPDNDPLAGTWFTNEIRRYSARVRTTRLSPKSGQGELDSLTMDASRAERIILYTYTRTLEGEGRLAIPASIARFVSGLAETGRLVVVAGGNPYQIRQMPQIPSYLVTYGRGEALERAAARAVLGRTAIGGRIPVSLPGYFARGDGLVRNAASEPAARVLRDPAVSAERANTVLDSMTVVLRRAVADGAFPGAYAAVGTVRGVIAEVGVGQLDADDVQRPNAETVWDLASLTKVIGTTTAVMQLVQAGKVALDAPVVRYLPDWNARGAATITVRHLLTHTGGLPAWRPLYKEATSASDAMQTLLATEPDTVPGVRFLYSDIGFILLGTLVERVSGEPLAQYDTAHVFGPLGMTDTRYLPPIGWRAHIAPTENDPWRQRHLRGEVHDENAAMLGGVSGHAGLFSSGRDLVRFARMYLGFGTFDGVRVLDSATVAAFTRVQNSNVSPRALGWETPTGGNSAGGRMSASAFGHTGFTGTSLWMDPTEGIFVLLLTNRVNPTRENRKIGSVRVGLADAVVGAWRGTAGRN